MNKGPRRDQLIIRSRCVVLLTWGPESDFPWAIGTYEAGEAFADYSRYFAPLVGSGSHKRWLRYDLLAQDGVGSNELVLKDEGWPEPAYLHALVLHGGDRAGWRLGVEPLPLRDP